MTDPLDYIRENLLHDPDCNDGFPDMTKAEGCTCNRAEVIAWAEGARQALAWISVLRGHGTDDAPAIAKRAIGGGDDG